MNRIAAIGFDLFNTLITLDPPALNEAMDRLIESLEKHGIMIDAESFRKAHREAALRFFEQARLDGRETHNRFWISAALHAQGHDFPPEDPRIAGAVEAYFSVFSEHCHLIPGSTETLRTLKEVYPLGLLSNFTHAPAAMEIIERLGLVEFFDVVLISGAIGYRKPHPLVFQKLAEGLRAETAKILYVGDDPEPDIAGSQKAGLQPVWTTYVRDHHIPLVQSILSSPSDPEDHVPRISTWEEFLHLLGMKR